MASEQAKRAPVQGFSAGIPWSMHLRAYDAYCKEYGKQEALIDLDGRNCRGGFSVGELDEFIPGWREELSEIAELRAENERLREEDPFYRMASQRGWLPLVEGESMTVTFGDKRYKVTRLGASQ